MFVDALHVKNFRSILDEVLPCAELTALVGANGAGKSTFLRAFDLFYSRTPRVDRDDFYNFEIDREISVAITFSRLSSAARERFANYVEGDTLTVERVFTAAADGKVTNAYHGSSLQAEAFTAIRDGLQVKDRGKQARSAYEAVRAQPDYADLPTWTTLAAVEPALTAWEQSHSAKCVRRRDDGRFFGFTEVGRGYLGRFTRFLFIPAVRDAISDAAEGRGSVLTELMDMVVRSVLANRAAVVQLKQEAQKQYEEIMRPENLPELQALSGQLTRTLQTFVPTAAVELKWLALEPVDIPMPKADVRLSEDRFATTVHRTGHGLQRAFILTMLQHLAMARPEVADPEPEPVAPAARDELPGLLLVIEEPELYQHPNRQRHLARIFLSLANGKTPGVADRTQVIYATHSPLFVDLERFDQIRIVRKKNHQADKPRISTVISTTLADVAEELWELDGSVGEKYSGATLRARLQSIMTPWVNEGFFADAVVLVEGDDDSAALAGMARANERDLESRGVSIIPVGGKRSLDRPAVIFRRFGIPTYLVWDSDGGKGASSGACDKCGRPLDGKPDPAENRRLLRLLGLPEEDWPNNAGPNHYCFGRDLESTVRTEIGEELYERLLAACQAEFEIRKRKHALKNPFVVGTMIARAMEQGRQLPSLNRVIEDVVRLTQ